MIPSANTAKRVNAPPENRSMKFRNVVWLLPDKFCFSAATLTTGTGTWEPNRYTAIMNRLNRIFLRRSGILNALTKPFSTSPLRASYRPNPSNPIGQGLPDVAPGQHLHGEPGPHEPALAHRVRVELLLLAEGLGQALDIHHRPL